MSIAVINAGSSTLKCALLERGSFATIWQGIMEYEDEGAKRFLQKAFTQHGQIVGVGHRIVHGGEKFIAPTLLTPSVLKELKRLSVLAPLHNPRNLQGVEWALELLPDVPHVGVFDTAFHHTLPPSHYIYPVPLGWLKKGIRRYGFHGINHQACYLHLKAIAPKRSQGKVITCHLGNGCSLAAIYKGASVDTTMGFTPMEGLMMGTRSGSIDPGIIFHLAKTQTTDSLERILNQDSGLKAIAGTHDMRKILAKIKKGDQKATLALELFCHILSKEIAAMAASLGGIDTLIFTGGIGENSPEVRLKACQTLSFLGIRLDKRKNKQHQEGLISSPDSQIAIYVFKSREEQLIAQETAALIMP